ncbi:MAG: helix-turn-helix domain-containing protein [Thermodesulfobacteriota bacterium]
MLIEHDWPGNVRELENVIRKAIAFTKTPYLTSYDLDLGPRIQSLEPAAGSVSYQDALRSSVKNLLGADGSEDVYGKIVKEAEVILLEEALQASGWNRSQAARVLGINRLTLRRKLEEYGIGVDQAADGD